MMKKLQTLLLIPALLLPVACDGGSDDSESSEAGTDDSGAESDSGAPLSFATDVQPILTDNCVAAGCHDSASEDVSYAEGEAYDNIVSQPSSIGMNLIEPGDPSMSYLWLKVDGGFAEVGGTGNPMPVGAMLAGADKATLEDWITQGAAP
jgi:hypothetical protein